MLVECGFVRASTGDGREFSFSPSLGRVAQLGPPAEIVRTFASLHGPSAAQEAAYVLALFCDQDDATPLVGWHAEDGWHDGLMPPAERVILARHLMQHAVCGRARPDADARRGEHTGRYAPEFHAAEFIALARAHLGLGTADAEALSMTELQLLLDAKYPRQQAKQVPTREEYDAAMRHFDEIAARRRARPAPEGVQ